MILTWLIGAVIVGFIGSSISRIGWFMSFFWSLLLSPIVGLIIVLCTQKKDEKLLNAVAEIKENTSIDNASNKIAKITEAKALLDAGAITMDEFEDLKQSIIKGSNSKSLVPNQTQEDSGFNNFMK